MSRRKDSELKAFQAIVKGRVQRVGYRRFILDLAQELGVVGFIENLRDGSVRIFCQAHPKVLSRFLRKARNPPQPAKVKQFDVKEVRSRPRLRYFRIKYGPIQEELQEGFGSMQAIFMDYWNEFRDYRGEFRDYRSEFRDFRSEFRSFVKEFRDYREEFRECAKRTDENFNKNMEKYGEISEKLTQILNTLIEESKKSKEMLERIEKDSKETRQTLSEAMSLLRQAVEKLSASR